MNISMREIIVFGLVVFGVVLLGLVVLVLIGSISWMPGGMMFPRSNHFMGLGPALLCALALILAGLSFGGIVLVIAASRKPETPTISQERCPNCGNPVQPVWQVCPHCATPLHEGDQG